MAIKITGLVVHNVARAEAYFRTKRHLDSSSCLATTDMGQKERGLCPFGGGLGPHLTQCGLGLPTKWHIDPSSRLAIIDMGQNAVPLFWWREDSGQ